MFANSENISMDWSQLMVRALQDGSIRELHLYQMPVLKNVENWNQVKEIGKVDFRGKHSDYKGAIVQYGSNYFFLPNARMDALSVYRKWNFKKNLRVVTEAEHKKKPS